MTTLVEPETELKKGDLVGEYEVDGVLGKGGFGAVYAATHPLIGKRVAIKVLRRKYSADPEIVSRFVSEARAVNQIRHQNIIDIFSFGKLADGRHYYVMELLEGTPLDRYLRDRGHLSIAEAVQILRPIARALDAAHAAGIVHRDLKPENVFVAIDAEGQPFPKLLDFGIAKLVAPETDRDHRTQTGSPMGTPLYMSPEQCRGRAVDFRSDLYSFGILTYQLLTGRLPFNAPDGVEIIFMQLSVQPSPPSAIRLDLPVAADAAVLAMLAKDPAHRPANVTDAVAALAASAGLPTGRGGDPLVSGAGRTPIRPVRPDAMLTQTSPDASAAALADTLTTPSTTSTSLGTGEVSSQVRIAPRRSRWPMAGVGLVLLAGGLAVWLGSRQGGGRGAEKTVAKMGSLGADAAAAPALPVLVDAAPVPPASVNVEILGVPAGTRVTTGAGVLLGSAPGVLVLPRGDAAVELRLEHAGYEPLQQSILPAADLHLQLTLKKKRGPGPGHKQPATPDEIGDFGK